MQQSFKRIFGLDLLRAIAITLVLISHCTFLLVPESDNILINFVRVLGAVGVDLFFVLSGYLIGGLLIKLITSREFTYSELFRFWKRRWLRTLPNYFLLLILNILVTLIFVGDLPNSIFKYFIFLQNFNSPHPDYFTEAWSLSIEEYAYLLLPFLLYLSMLLFKNKDKMKVFIVTTICIILVLNAFKILYFLNVDIDSYKAWSSSFRKVVVYRLDSIYYGFVTVFLYKKYFSFIKKYKNLLFFIGLFLFAILHASIFVFNILPEHHLGYYTFIYLQGVCISLAFLFPYFLTINMSGNQKRIVEFVSTRSYAIYLINYSFILLNVKQIIDVPSLSIMNKGLVLLLFLLVTTVLSNLIYKYFEKPILAYRNRKFPK